MKIIPCPMCGTERAVDWEEYSLIVRCNQFMCWADCGMDIFLPPMYLIFHARNQEEE